MLEVLRLDQWKTKEQQGSHAIEQGRKHAAGQVSSRTSWAKPGIGWTKSGHSLAEAQDERQRASISVDRDRAEAHPRRTARSRPGIGRKSCAVGWIVLKSIRSWGSHFAADGASGG